MEFDILAHLFDFLTLLITAVLAPFVKFVEWARTPLPEVLEPIDE